MMGSVKMVIDQRKAYQQADQYLELQGKVRAALDIISAEIRMAGSGVNQPFANPIYYAFNDPSTLGDYPTLSDLKDSTLGASRSFGAIGFQYDRSIETRNDGTVLRDTITNGDVMLIAPSSMDSGDASFKTVKMETWTDEGTTQCSLTSSTSDCVAAYVSSGSTAIDLLGETTTEVFKLNMYTITSNGNGKSTNELLDYVISFDVTYYVDASDTGYTDVATMALGSLGDDHDNDGDGSTDEKGELITITDTTTASGFCGGSEVFCDVTDGILTIPVVTRNSTVDDVTDISTISPTTDVHDISADVAATAVTFSSTPTISAGSAGDYVTIVNTGQYPITFTDNDILTNSNLQLKRDTVVLSSNQSLSLQYSGGEWVQTSPAVANIAAVKITLTARSEKRDPSSGKYLIYSGTITTKLRGYAL